MQATIFPLAEGAMALPIFLNCPLSMKGDWRKLAHTVAIDWNYYGDALKPVIYGNKNGLAKGAP